MCSENKLNEALKIFVDEIKVLFKEDLRGVILFGSYARGNYDAESDIDIMVLVDIEKAEIKKYRGAVLEIVTKLDWDYDIILSPIVQNNNEFEIYKNASGFFKNVSNEGVRLSA